VRVRKLCSKTPTVLWAQRTSCVYLTFEVAGCVEPDIHIEPSGTHVSVSLTTTQRAPADTADRFRVELDLWGAVVPEVRIACLHAGPLCVGGACALGCTLKLHARRRDWCRGANTTRAHDRWYWCWRRCATGFAHTARVTTPTVPSWCRGEFDRLLVWTAAQAKPGFWPRLLQPKGPAPRHLKVDWNMWVDEDEEDEKPQCAAHV
jgi:hypothetical protein